MKRMTLCHADVLLQSLVESLWQYAAVDKSLIVASEPLSPLVYQLPVAAADQHTTDEDEHLSPLEFQLPVAAADQHTTKTSTSLLRSFSCQLLLLTSTQRQASLSSGISDASCWWLSRTS